MAYLTCPWCLAPQQVGDQERAYQCYTCYVEVAFFECPECHFLQTVSKRWTACTCGRCEAKVELPRRWGFVAGATAERVEGWAQTWPKL